MPSDKNVLLLIVLDSCARLNSAHWHYLSLTFPVQIPCCLWMLAVCNCVHLPLVSASQEECHFPVLSTLLPSVSLFFFTLLSLTLQSFLRADAALPWTYLAGNARSVHFPLAECQQCPSSPQCTFCSLAGIALDLACSWVDVVCLLKRHLFLKTALLLPATVQNQ